MFFERRKLDALGVGDDMANYLSMSLNPNAGAMMRFAAEYGTLKGVYEERVKAYEDKVDELLAEHNVDYVGLLKMIAVG